MNTFNIFGYSPSANNGDDLLELNEISLQADPEILRAIADLLNKSADELESNQKEWSHIHLQDEWKKWSANYPDVIVANPIQNS